MHRLFVAIRPPEHTRDQLIDVMEDGADFRWQEDEQLHLTLRFAGEVEPPVAEDLALALSTVRAPPFALRLAGAGQFDHRGGGALWAGIEPRGAVIALAAKIERACQSAGLEPERRTFHPHITLARWKGRRRAEVRDFLERHGDLASDAWQVGSFSLYESHLSRHGARYQAVADYPLSE